MKFLLAYLFFSVIFSDCAKIPHRNREPKIHVYRPNKLTSLDVPKTDLNVSTRIYGGSYAPEGKFKFMIFSMFCPEENFQKGVFSCSASLIKPDWVLLAAHCFAETHSPKSSSVLLVGGKADLNSYVKERLRMDYYAGIDESKHNVQERRANHIYVNDRYNVETKEHDIALVRLQKPFDIGRTIQTVPFAYDEMRSSLSCTILGWGLIENDTRSYMLMYANGVNVQTVKEGCEFKPDGDFICLQKGINMGICHGDSGSPLICSNQVWGVASHLVSYEESPRCGEELEEYYTELYPNLDWVRNTLVKVEEPVEDTSRPIQPQDDTGTGTSSKTVANLAIIIISFVILR